MAATDVKEPSGYRTTPDVSPNDRTIGDWGLLGLLLLCMLGFTVLSLRQPLSADDFTNSLVLQSNPSVWGFVRYYYLAWTGRATGMALLWFALSNRAVFAVLNGLAFMGLAWLTLSNALGRLPRMRGTDLGLLGFVVATYWYGLPAISETAIWITGSVTYLWSAVLMLAFALPYRLSGNAEDGATSERLWPRELLLAAPMLALGALAGASQELVVAALMVLLLAFVYDAFRRRELGRIPIHLWAGAAGFVAGGAVVLLAPGNQARSAVSGNQAASLVGSLAQFATYVAKTFGSYLPRMYPWLLCILVVAIPVTVIAGSSHSARPARPLWLVWLLAALATVAPFVLKPGVGLLAGARTNTMLAVLLLVAAVSLLSEPGSLLEHVPGRWISMAVGFILLLVLLEIAGSVQVANAIRSQVLERESTISVQRGAGVRDITVAPLAQKPYRTVYYVDITADPAYWLNAAMAKWYGVDSIRLSDAPEP